MKKTKDKSKLKYSIHGHRAVFLTLLVCSVMACMIIFAILIGLLFNALGNVKWLTVGGDVAYLADFVSGMLGIIIGFMLDFMFIDRLKRIKDYQEVLTTLGQEFKGILYRIRNNEIIKDKVREPVDISIVEEIVHKISNRKIFISLPRYYPWKDKPGEAMLTELSDLHVAIKEYNKNYVKTDVENSIMKFENLYPKKQWEKINGTKNND